MYHLKQSMFCYAVIIHRSTLLFSNTQHCGVLLHRSTKHCIMSIRCNTSPPQSAVACNPELFPISHYYVTISGLAGNLTVPAVDSPTAFSLALTSTFFPELREDSNYTVNVQTCTAYVCEETPASVTVGKAIYAVSCSD